MSGSNSLSLAAVIMILVVYFSPNFGTQPLVLVESGLLNQSLQK